MYADDTTFYLETNPPLSSNDGDTDYDTESDLTDLEKESSKQRLLSSSSEDSERTEDDSPVRVVPDPLGSFVDLVWNRRYLSLALITAVCSAMRSLLSKIILITVEPVLLSFVERLMMMLSAVPLLIYFKLSLRIPQHVYFIVPLAGVLSAAQMVLIMVAFKLLYVADASTIAGVNPIIAGVLGWLFLSEKLTAWDILASVIAFISLTLLSKPEELIKVDLLADNWLLLGFLAAVSAAFIVAIGTILRRMICLRQVNAHVSVFYINLISSLICAVIVTVSGKWHLPAKVNTIVLLVASGVLGYIGNVAMMVAMVHESAFLVALVSASNVPMIYVLQVTVLSVVPDLYSYFGAGFIVLSIILVSLQKRNIK